MQQERKRGKARDESGRCSKRKHGREKVNQRDEGNEKPKEEAS